MRTRRDSGVALPSYVTIAAIVLVVVAAIVLIFANRGGDEGDSAATDPSAPITAPAETPTPETPPTDAATTSSAPSETASAAPTRADLGVYVWNTTSINGLAKRVGDYATGKGWTFLGSDNWTGTVPPETTIFYPVGKKALADLLSEDLGIPRQAIADENGVATDRLTIVLTGVLPTVS